MPVTEKRNARGNVRQTVAAFMLSTIPKVVLVAIHAATVSTLCGSGQNQIVAKIRRAKGTAPNHQP